MMYKSTRNYDDVRKWWRLYVINILMLLMYSNYPLWIVFSSFFLFFLLLLLCVCGVCTRWVQILGTRTLVAGPLEGGDESFSSVVIFSENYVVEHVLWSVTLGSGGLSFWFTFPKFKVLEVLFNWPWWWELNLFYCDDWTLPLLNYDFCFMKWWNNEYV